MQMDAVHRLVPLGTTTMGSCSSAGMGVQGGHAGNHSAPTPPRGAARSDTMPEVFRTVQCVNESQLR